MGSERRSRIRRVVSAWGLILAQAICGPVALLGGEAPSTIVLMEDGYQIRRIGEIPNAVKIAAAPAGGHVLVLTGEGRVWAWGDNTYGQLGTGDTGPVRGWREVAELTDVVAIAAGAQHSAALRRDGTVWTWGANAMGQLGDGTLVAHLKPRQVAGLRGMTAVAASTLSTAALRDDGTVLVFGSNWEGMAAQDVRKMITPAVPTGRMPEGAEIEFRGGRVVEKIRGETDWLDTRGVQRKVVYGTDRIRILENGRDSYGHEVEGTLMDLAAGWAVAWIEGSREAEALDDRGSISAEAWDQKHLTEQAATTGSLRSALAAGQVRVAASRGGEHSLRVNPDGTVWAFGNNGFGQLGNGGFEPQSKPVQVTGLGGIVSVAAGGSFSMALGSDGTVWEWGLGADWLTGTKAMRVPGLTSVVAIAAGEDHRLVLKSDGTVWAWGSNNGYGQIGDGTHTR